MNEMEALKTELERVKAERDLYRDLYMAERARANVIVVQPERPAPVGPHWWEWQPVYRGPYITSSGVAPLTVGYTGN
jgi:hypothetical protein